MKKRQLKNKLTFNPMRLFRAGVCTALLGMSAQTMFPHGTVTSPPSRVWNCFQENPESPDSAACEAAVRGWGTQAFYDWSEVARMDAGGRHRQIISDGNLASAGRPDKYGGLDQVRNDWVTTKVSPGPFQVIWTNQAPHKTLYYDVYITKASWTPDQPLTWDSLELLVRTDPREAAATDIINVTLPQRTGKHVIYSVWQRSLTPEAFYSTSDVDFGGGNGTPPGSNNRPPVADIETTSIDGRTVSFDFSGSSDPDGDDLTYNIDYGYREQDQNVGTSVTHTYQITGTFTATVLVTDSKGLTDTASVTVNLTNSGGGNPPPANRPPVADLTVTPGTTGTAPFAVRFDASGSSDPDGDDLTYDILYGNGNMGTNLNVNSPYTYFEPGTYTATLTVRDGKGGSDTATVTITVNGSGGPVDPPAPTGDDGFVGMTSVGDFSDNADAPSGPYALTAGNNAVRATQSGEPRDIDYFTVTVPTGYEMSELLVSEFSNTANPGFIGITEGNTSAPQTGVGLLGGTLFGGTVGANLLGTPGGVSGPGFSETYGAGTYTVWLNQTAGTTTTVLTFVLTEVSVVVPPVEPPTTDNCKFGAPSASPLPSIQTSYANAYVLGTGGPDLSAVRNLHINWDAEFNGLYHFALNLGAAPWYVNLTQSTQSFNQSNPKVTLANTGVTGLDGEYDVTVHNENLVLAADTYTLYFSKSETAPQCNTGAKADDSGIAFSMFPNPAVSTVRLSSASDLSGSVVTIADINGKVVKSLTISASTTTLDIDVNSVTAGLYLVSVIEPTGAQRTLKLIKN